MISDDADDEDIGEVVDETGEVDTDTIPMISSSPLVEASFG